MHRWSLLMTLLAPIAVGCDDSSYKLETAVEPPSPEDTTCDWPGEQIRVGVVGKPLRFRLRNTLVAQSCECEYKTSGCFGSRECVSDYDLGHDNPRRCTPEGVEPATIDSASARVLFDDRFLDPALQKGSFVPPAETPCAVTTTIDEDRIALVVTCSKSGFVDVVVDVQSNEVEFSHLEFVHMLVTDDGRCTPARE